MKKFPCLSPDPAEGGDPAQGHASTPSNASDQQGRAPSTPPGGKAIPQAAKTVLEGLKTEREAALERDLKAREVRLAELEDENRRLKAPPTPQPRPAPEKKSFLSGATFFDEEED